MEERMAKRNGSSGFNVVIAFLWVTLVVLVWKFIDKLFATISPEVVTVIALSCIVLVMIAIVLVIIWIPRLGFFSRKVEAPIKKAETFKPVKETPTIIVLNGPQGTSQDFERPQQRLLPEYTEANWRVIKDEKIVTDITGKEDSEW
jgi:hypothetical protein